MARRSLPPSLRVLLPCLVVMGVGSGAPVRAETEAPSRIRLASFAEDACKVVEEEADRHALPAAFFGRLIWRESLFNPNAVSRRGAQGIGQFMPGTAAERGLRDPFDAAASLVASARYLRDLKARFGSLGLAAAAYNAGPTRVAAWIAGSSQLPLETQNYVLWITGRSADEWRASEKALPVLPIADGLSFAAACRKLASRGLTAKLPDRALAPAGWQRLFRSDLGIQQIAPTKVGRVRVVIDTEHFSAKAKATARRNR